MKIVCICWLILQKHKQKKSDDVVQLKSVVVVVVVVVVVRRTRDCKFKSKPTNAHDN